MVTNRTLLFRTFSCYLSLLHIEWNSTAQASHEYQVPGLLDIHMPPLPSAPACAPIQLDQCPGNLHITLACASTHIRSLRTIEGVSALFLSFKLLLPTKLSYNFTIQNFHFPSELAMQNGKPRLRQRECRWVHQPTTHEATCTTSKLCCSCFFFHCSCFSLHLGCVVHAGKGNTAIAA
jgi:hypothetical protein